MSIKRKKNVISTHLHIYNDKIFFDFIIFMAKFLQSKTVDETKQGLFVKTRDLELFKTEI